MRLHLIRHGRTKANEKGVYCGKTDLPLTDSGRSGLLEMRARGIYPSADVYYTSGALRAEETLRLLYEDVPFIALPGFAEYDFGIFEMKSYEELRLRRDYLDWILDETGKVACPGGESRGANRHRVLSALKKLREELETTRRDAALVAHGGSIALIMDHMFPDERNFYEWQPAPGRGYSLVPDGNGLYGYHII